MKKILFTILFLFLCILAKADKVTVTPDDLPITVTLHAPAIVTASATKTNIQGATLQGWTIN